MQSFSQRDIFTTFALLCLYFTMVSFEAGMMGSMVVTKNITTAISAYSTASKDSFAASPVRLTNSRKPLDTPRKLHRTRPINGATISVTSPSTPVSMA